MGAAVASVVAVAVGAILRFATTVHSTVWNIKAVGDIVMVAGAVGLLMAGLAWAYWDGVGVQGYIRRRSTIASDGRGVVYSPSGYARTTFDSNYPAAAAVPVDTTGLDALGVVADGFDNPAARTSARTSGGTVYEEHTSVL